MMVGGLNFVRDICIGALPALSAVLVYFLQPSIAGVVLTAVAMSAAAYLLLHRRPRRPTAGSVADASAGVLFSGWNNEKGEDAWKFFERWAGAISSDRTDLSQRIDEIVYDEDHPCSGCSSTQAS